jgi:hypothetical protein
MSDWTFAVAESLNPESAGSLSVASCLQAEKCWQKSAGDRKNEIAKDEKLKAANSKRLDRISCGTGKGWTG